MTNLTEIESAIKQLPQNEAKKLSEWLQDYIADEWDRQMQADARSGKLDKLINQAEADINAGRIKNLDEVIHNA